MQLSRLTINGWHPIASHLVCLILGIAMSNLLNQQVRASSPLRSDLTFSIPKKLLVFDSKTVGMGSRVNVYRVSDPKNSCRMFRAKLQAAQEEERVIITSESIDHEGLGLLAKDLRQNRKVTIRRDYQKIPLCRTKSKVSYGD